MRYLILLFLFSCGMVPDKFVGDKMSETIHSELNKSVVYYYLPSFGSCSASVVAKDVIITALHCVEGYEGQYIYINDKLYTIANMSLISTVVSEDGEEDGIVLIGLVEDLIGDFKYIRLPTDNARSYRHYIKCWNANDKGHRTWVDNDSLTFHIDVGYFNRQMLYLERFKNSAGGCSGGGIFDANGVLRGIYYGTVYGYIDDTYSVGIPVNQDTLSNTKHYVNMLHKLKRRLK